MSSVETLRKTVKYKKRKQEITHNSQTRDNQLNTWILYDPFLKCATVIIRKHMKDLCATEGLWCERCFIIPFHLFVKTNMWKQNGYNE